MKRQFLILWFCIISETALCGQAAWAAERGAERSPLEVDVTKLSREAPESTSFWEFLKERTQLGYGFDETLNDNLFLQDNNKVEEYISTLEAEVFFSDPRGTFLYGFDYEVNAYRYHRNNSNAIDHDAGFFATINPGGRYKFDLNYRMKTHNSLIFGVEGIDVIRRSSDFQRQVNHTWSSSLTYALNDTNYLVPSASYSLFDDQSREDANSDRKAFSAAADIDHDLKPGWTVFTGYGFGDAQIPGNKIKNSTTHSLRLGTKYALTEIVDLDFLLTFGRVTFDSGQRDSAFSIEGKWSYKAGPRTTVLLKYKDGAGTSFTAGRLKFRSSAPSGEIAYDLSKLTKLTLKADYEKQHSSGQDALVGTPATSITSQRYGLGAGILWQIREKTKVTVDYNYSRSKTADYTNRFVTVGMEGNF